MKQTVELRNDKMHDDEYVYKHPAQGKIEITKSSGDFRLFGSDLQHHGAIHICIKDAVAFRHLNREWIYGTNTILDLYISEAQWATMVSSIGSGDGTPCTFRVKPESPSVMNVPDFEPALELREKIKQDVDDDIKRYSEEPIRKINELVKFVEECKTIPKKELSEKLRNLQSELGNMPANLRFLMTSIEESVDETLTDAKIEFEGYVENSLKKIGVEAINNQEAMKLLLTNKE